MLTSLCMILRKFSHVLVQTCIGVPAVSRDVLKTNYQAIRVHNFKRTRFIFSPPYL